jgi:hypothetical protein
VRLYFRQLTGSQIARERNRFVFVRFDHPRHHTAGTVPCWARCCARSSSA